MQMKKKKAILKIHIAIIDNCFKGKKIATDM